MLDASSGQNIVLEQEGGKIVPKVKDAPSATGGKSAKKEPKKDKDSKKDETEGAEKPKRQPKTEL